MDNSSGVGAVQLSATADSAEDKNRPDITRGRRRRKMALKKKPSGRSWWRRTLVTNSAERGKNMFALFYDEVRGRYKYIFVTIVLGHKGQQTECKLTRHPRKT